MDWVQEDGRADTAAVERWAADTVSRESAGELALFWAAVLTSADALLAGEETELACLSDAGYSLRYESYDPLLLRAAEKELSPLFTQLLSRVETTPYAYEETMPYDAVTLEKLEGLWLDSELGEMLVISGAPVGWSFPIWKTGAKRPLPSGSGTAAPWATARRWRSTFGARGTFGPR